MCDLCAQLPALSDPQERFVTAIKCHPLCIGLFPLPDASAKVRSSVTDHSHQASRFVMTTSTQDPLHGVTLEQILKALVEHYQWSGLAERIDIRCFKSDPSIKSSLTFLRKTPWAREKVEALYVKLHRSKGW
jgi:hypothetical protein